MHPVKTKANDPIPVYRHWNQASHNCAFFDEEYEGLQTGRRHTSRPDGAVDDVYRKLYPFEYKTFDYPLRADSNQLTALDTSVFFANADADAAALSGLENTVIS